MSGAASPALDRPMGAVPQPAVLVSSCWLQQWHCPLVHLWLIIMQQGAADGLCHTGTVLQCCSVHAGSMWICLLPVQLPVHTQST